jgi:hypothetical protein
VFVAAMVQITTREAGITEPTPKLERRLAALVSPVALRRTVMTLGIVILTFAVVGTLKYYVVKGRFGRFDLDSEYGPPAIVSAVVVGLAALASVACAYVSRGLDRLWFAALAALFALMALDELFTLHERLERHFTVQWQLIYSPVMLFAAIALVMLVRDTWPDRAPVTLLVGGALAWGFSQLLDLVQWTGEIPNQRKVEGYGVLMITEETLELAGSSMFLVALLILLARRLDRPVPAVVTPRQT